MAGRETASQAFGVELDPFEGVYFLPITKEDEPKIRAVDVRAAPRRRVRVGCSSSGDGCVVFHRSNAATHVPAAARPVPHRVPRHLLRQPLPTSELCAARHDRERGGELRGVGRPAGRLTAAARAQLLGVATARLQDSGTWWWLWQTEEAYVFVPPERCRLSHSRGPPDTFQRLAWWRRSADAASGCVS